jgi:hypothetical protein
MVMANLHCNTFWWLGKLSGIWIAHWIGMTAIEMEVLKYDHSQRLIVINT